MTKQKSIAIIGAGPSGLAMAGLLARRGHQITVYESRPDPRVISIRDSRSINLTLSARGLTVLDQLGIAERVKALSNTIGARMIHTSHGQQILQRYGAQEHEVLYGIARETFLVTLLQYVCRLPNVDIQFNTRLVDFNKASKAVSLRETISTRSFTVWPDLLIGADGVFSAVRHQIGKREMADLVREYFPWTYKEVIIPAANARVLDLRTDVLHVWPRPHGLLVAFANPDGSLGCNLFLDRQGQFSFAALNDERRLEKFLATTFDELAPIAADLARQLVVQKEGGVVRVRSSRWHYGDSAVLIGDAAHAIYQFYGHGTSADLEDCWTLDQCLLEYPGDIEAAFRAFEARRMDDTWELSELSRKHFFTLKDRSATILFRARLATDTLLAITLPGLWHLEYALVAHSAQSYRTISRLMRRQQLIWWLSGLFLATGAIMLFFLAEVILHRVKNWRRQLRVIHRMLVKPA